MKIYTVQSKDFGCFVDKEVYIMPQKCDWGKDTIEWVDDVKDVYRWMANQYSIRTGISANRYLIWVYFRMRDVPWKYIDFDKYNVFCFEISNKLLYKNFLWSDLIDWHWHLNHLENWETKTDIFDLKKHSKNIVPQGVTTRLKKEWIKKVYKNL
ncbi:hypothetical protein [Enterococcus faecalis]|uniref:hypothetical protein n=1 Tax=Enterococcus faecalis TaxID=1351 RepID=UPI0021C5C718|nr:hypothetical protein [Enterococcus faecalis]